MSNTHNILGLQHKYGPGVYEMQPLRPPAPASDEGADFAMPFPPSVVPPKATGNAEEDAPNYANYLRGCTCILVFVAVCFLATLVVIFGLQLRAIQDIQESVNEIDFAQWNNLGIGLMREPLDATLGAGSKMQMKGLLDVMNDLAGQTSTQMNTSQIVTHTIDGMTNALRFVNDTVATVDRLVPAFLALVPDLMVMIRHAMASTNGTLFLTDGLVPQFVDEAGTLLSTLKQVNARLQTLFGSNAALTIDPGATPP